jgi:hypothetical protein
MTKLTFKTKLILFFGIYLLFRISIFNINAAEWGDSYRILRATNFLEKNTTLRMRKGLLYILLS